MDACHLFANGVRARAGTALIAGPHDLQDLQVSSKWTVYFIISSAGGKCIGGGRRMETASDLHFFSMRTWLIGFCIC